MAYYGCMASQPAPNPDRTEPPLGGRFSWAALALWLPACALLGVAAAWVADIASSDLGFTPLVIFPLLVGLGVGGMLIAVMRLGQVAHWPTIVAGALLAVMVTAVGQHYFAFQSARRRAEQQVRQVEQQYARELHTAEGAFDDVLTERMPKPPPTFSEYLSWGRRMWDDFVVFDWVAWLTWGIDGLLVLGAALAVVIPAAMLPYCNCCRKWYRTVRSARIELSTAGHLAEVAGLDAVEQPRSARYRLSSCPGGCSPTRFELSWEATDGKTYLARTWLDTQQRNQVTEVLDESTAADEEPDGGGRTADGGGGGSSLPPLQ